jgi:hypothetical protein
VAQRSSVAIWATTWVVARSGAMSAVVMIAAAQLA